MQGEDAIAEMLGALSLHCRCLPSFLRSEEPHSHVGKPKDLNDKTAATVHDSAISHGAPIILANGCTNCLSRLLGTLSATDFVSLVTLCVAPTTSATC